MTTSGNKKVMQKKLLFAGLPDSMDGVSTVTSAASTPTFRSVSFGGSALPGRTFAEGHRSNAERGGSVGGDWQSKSPPITRCRSAAAIGHAHNTKSPEAADFVALRCRGSSGVQKTNWFVCGDGLRSVPPLYPLERSTRYIVGTAAGTIAARISECCRIMSVQAKFDHQAATAILRTEEHVELKVFLWRGTKPNEPPGCIIVEVQRRKGDATKYHKYCRNILDAAEGTFNAEDFAAEGAREKSFTKIAWKMLAEEEPLVDSTEQRDNALISLEIVASLLRNDRFDAQVLAMESLCLLTDPTRSGWKTALMVSQVVLAGSLQDEPTGIDAGNLGIKEALLPLVLSGRLAKDGTSDQESVSPEEHEHNSLLHDLSLAVLANVLDVVAKSGTGPCLIGREPPASVAKAFLTKTNGTCGRDLLSQLLDGVGSARSNLHDACLSAQCLKSIFEVSTEAKHLARDLNAKEAISRAFEVGRQTSVRLETETAKLFLALEDKREGISCNG